MQELGTPGITRRLLLRNWKEADKAPFRLLNADPRVMEYFLAPLSETESDALANRIVMDQKARGFSFWALELQATASFIGFVGLSIPRWKAPFTPCVEIGWRLAHDYWGYGYATEAAQAVLAFGFEKLGLNEIVSFTAQINQRSQRVMQRLGMMCSEDFLHPALPPESPLSKHVLYHLTRERWIHLHLGRSNVAHPRSPN